MKTKTLVDMEDARKRQHPRWVLTEEAKLKRKKIEAMKSKKNLTRNSKKGDKCYIGCY